MAKKLSQLDKVIVSLETKRDALDAVLGELYAQRDGQAPRKVKAKKEPVMP